MTSNPIPDDVKQFLVKNVDSIAQWEGLLLIRSKPEVEWSADMIAKNLYIDEREAGRLLSHLCTQGFLSLVAGKYQLSYHYKPNSQKLEQMTERVAELYKQYLIPITHFIHSKSQTRVREFANAFKIRKD